MVVILPMHWGLSRDGELLKKYSQNLTIRFLQIKIWGKNN
jgi:hypothetical protein